MAKKSSYAAAAARRRQEVSHSTAAKVAKAPVAPPPVDFHEEYRYVLSDLKRFGLTAAAMIVLLIVLALTL